MKTSVSTDYAIEAADLTGVSDEAVRPFVELMWEIDHEAVPEDPRRPFAAVAHRLRMYTSLFERWRWAAWTPERELAGQVVMSRSNTDNFHMREVHVQVRREHRRHGLGGALLRRAVDAIGADPAAGGKAIVLEGWTTSRIPAAEAFARSIGAEPGLRMRASQLALSTIDRAKMREWAAIDPAGYRLEWIDGETPDRLMPHVVKAQVTMNTMPREGMHWEDWKVTPEVIREWERLSKERGQRRLMVIAVEDGTEETASFTEVFFDPRIPSVVHQGGTATIPAHRGKGLGKWVKARMVERILGELPDARYVRTENAGSNDAMLAINVGMGFTPAWEEIIWQVPVADARKALAR